MGGIIDNLFGGGKPDDSAAKIAQAQMEAQQQQAAQEQARWQSEQDRVAKDKQLALDQQAKDKAATDKQLADQQLNNAKQNEAKAATGPGIQYDQTTAAKAMAASDAGGVPLPGYQQLSKLANQGQQGYAGQTNTIVSPTGFNSKQVGGRRYV